jgi:sulfur-oxidizing protein SoxY
MNNTRRTVIKTTSALGTLVALGLVTQQQAMAAVDRAAFDVKSIADAVKAIGGTAANSCGVSRHR